MQTSVFNQLQQNDPPFIRAIAETHLNELLSGGENDDSYSSPMSNKSEKNMADFDDDDSPCEEELAQLASRPHCLAQFSIPRSRPMAVRENSQSADITEVSSSKDVKNNKQDDVNMTTNTTTNKDEILQQPVFKISEVCQPGNTLLWDLLQDDKIVSILKCCLK